jgi:ElaB/YqjD/DUF883 family membrane-anchored ribosome-binding protein
METKPRTHRHASAHGNRDGDADLQSQVATLGRDVQELASAAGDAARAQFGPIAEYVREQPVKALFMAAGVGALLGLILRRR